MNLLRTSFVFAGLVTSAMAQNISACTSNANCTDTEFCGTNDLCNPLDCPNWALYAKAYDIDTAPGCDTEQLEFCGNDGLCHDYSCENWYKYGIAAYTGYTDGSPELTCSTYDTGEADTAYSVIYGCRIWNFGGQIDESKSWADFFNQKCTATPSSGTDFECYDINALNWNYQDFTAQAARINPPSCGGSGAFTQPRFRYLTSFRQKSSDGASVLVRPAQVSTDSFNPNVASKAMHAIITGYNPSETPGTGEGSSSGAKKASASVLALLTSLLIAL